MRAILLCGGVGKRMLPIVEEKYFLRFNGETLLERWVRILRENGISDIQVVSSPSSAERIRAMGLDVVVQPEPKGMADAVMRANLDGEVLIINPNDVVEPWLVGEVLKEDMAVPGYVVDSYFPGGYLIGEEKMEGLVEKPPPGEEPSNLVKLVVDKIDGDILRRELERHSGDDAYEKALAEIAKDHEIRIVKYSGRWQAIKYPWHILKVMDMLFDEMDASILSSDVSEKAEIEGKVRIEEGVKVLPTASIRGPAYIGPSSFIGSHSIIWGGTSLDGQVVVGAHTEIKHSYIMAGTWFHRNYVGDSVIGKNCSFGAGTVISNFRFDEKPVKVEVNGKKVDTGMMKLGAIIGDSCKTGINVSIMPGRKIGPNSIIGPHTIVTEDVPPETYLMVEQLKVRRKNILEIDPALREKLLIRLTSSTASGKGG